MTGGEVVEHGDPVMYGLSRGERIRRECYLAPPARNRLCMYRSAFPCNGACRMERRCLEAAAAREGGPDAA